MIRSDDPTQAGGPHTRAARFFVNLQSTLNQEDIWSDTIALHTPSHIL